MTPRHAGRPGTEPSTPSLVGIVSGADVTEEWQYEPRPEVIRLADVPFLRVPQTQEPIKYLPDFGPDLVCACKVQQLPDGRHARVLVDEPRIHQHQAWIVVRIRHRTGSGQVRVVDGSVDGLLPTTPGAPHQIRLDNSEVWPLWSCADPPHQYEDLVIYPRELAVRLAHRNVVVVRVGRSTGLMFPPECPPRVMAETFVAAGFLPPVDLGPDLDGQSPEPVLLAHYKALSRDRGHRDRALEATARCYTHLFGVSPEQRLEPPLL